MVRFAAVALALAVSSLGMTAFGAQSEILLLDFWSPQCGPCMQMKPTMHALEQANYPIREVDTTQDMATSSRYGVSAIPCFIMLVDGKEVDRQVGPTSSEHLQQMFQHAKDIVIDSRRMRGQSPDTQRAPATGPPTTSNGPAPRLDSTPSPQPTAGRDSWPPTAAGATPFAQVANTNAPPTVAPMAAAASSNTDFPPNLMAATVRIRVEDAGGRSFGTGTVIDSRSGEALILTCGHLFREAQGKGPITVELFDVSPAGTKVAAQVPGQLISYDLKRDVAFVSVRPNRDVAVAPVAPAKTQVQRGDRVATIGCSNGKDPTLLPQRVNTLDRYQGPPNIEVSGAPEEGRSGGGLFNLQGQLIGVCYAADYEGKEGLYAALDSIHEELDRLHLQDVYAKSGTPAATPSAPPKVASDQPFIVRGQEPPLATTTPIGATSAPPTVGSKADSLPKLSDAEQASFGEIMQRASTSEVVVIVRPKTPGGQSEVITLDSVSPEFVRALAARQRGPQAAATR